MEFLTEYGNIITAVIAAASAIANVTPTKKDDQVIGWVSKLINVFALNFRK
jgi:hypothetical protein